MNELVNKPALRFALKQKRLAIFNFYQENPLLFEQKVLENIIPVLNSLIPRKTTHIAGYHPVHSEFNCLPIIYSLSQRYKVSLPVVVKKHHPLIFREWDCLESSLTTGIFKLKVPCESSPETRPEIVLTPLLAYNAEKYRIGFGGGFYDRTFMGLDCVKIGLCFKEQLTEFAIEPHDIKLDYIVTEEGII